MGKNFEKTSLMVSPLLTSNIESSFCGMSPINALYGAYIEIDNINKNRISLIKYILNV